MNKPLEHIQMNRNLYRKLGLEELPELMNPCVSKTQASASARRKMLRSHRIQDTNPDFISEHRLFVQGVFLFQLAFAFYLENVSPTAVEPGLRYQPHSQQTAGDTLAAARTVRPVSVHIS